MRIKAFKTDNAVIYALRQPTQAQLDEIDTRIKRGAHALVLGTYPAMSLGFIDLRDFSCEYPLSNALAVSKELLRRVGGMDRRLGVTAGMELCQRIKAAGGKIEFAGDILLSVLPGECADISDCLLGCILYDAKYSDSSEFKRSLARIKGALVKDPALGDHSRKRLLSLLPGFCLNAACLRLFSRKRTASSYHPDFLSIQKRGVYSVGKTSSEQPLVSIIIRTYRRPETLRKTLECLKYQAYKNFECIVIEDGEPTARSMVENDFPALAITYRATGTNRGRAAAANLGFSMAHGKYINMLDDDDFLYPEHIQAGVDTAEATDSDMVFLQSLSLLTTTHCLAPYEYDINDVQFMNSPRIDSFTMSQTCLTPNNGVMFRKELFEQLGGMREELGANEDWSLWLRYMTRAKFTVIPFATCVFLNPASPEEREKRIKQYSPFDGMQFDDPLLVYTTSGAQLRGYLDGMLADWHYLAQLGWLDDELESQIAARKPASRQKVSFDDELQASAELTANDFRDIYDSFLCHLQTMSSEQRYDYLMSEYAKTQSRENNALWAE